MVVYQSFLVNKIPLLLSELVGPTISQETAELCLSQTLTRLDPTVFPPLSSALEISPEKSNLSDFRQEFLFACALHKLISEGTAKRLLGEDTMQGLPKHGLYSKQELAQQTLSGTRKADQLVEEIGAMEGNSGIIAQTLIEVMYLVCIVAFLILLRYSTTFARAKRP